MSGKIINVLQKHEVPVKPGDKKQFQYEIDVTDPETGEVETKLSRIFVNNPISKMFEDAGLNKL